MAHGPGRKMIFTEAPALQIDDDAMKARLRLTIVISAHNSEAAIAVATHSQRYPNRYSYHNELDK